MSQILTIRLYWSLLFFAAAASTGAAATPSTITQPTSQPTQRGVVQLDLWSFDKVVTGRYPVIVQFSSPNATGYLPAWQKLIRGTFTIKGIVFGHVSYNILDQELRDRYNVSDTDLPAFVFFPKFNVHDEENMFPQVQKYETNSIVGKYKYTKKSLFNFIRKHTTSVWIGQQGCLESFDTMARQMRQKSVPIKVLIERAKSQQVQKHDQVYADYYIEVLQRYSTQPGYLSREYAKLKRRRSAAAREDRRLFSRKLNILDCFVGGKVVELTDERKIKREEEEDKHFLRTGRIMGFGQAKSMKRVRDDDL
jgi:hypothetical protein